MSLRLELDKELERKFRELAMRRYGFSKGSIKKAAEVAIKRWSEEEKITKPMKKKGKSGVDLLVGLLADVKHKSSVEEQHEIKKLWVKAAEDK